MSSTWSPLPLVALLLSTMPWLAGEDVKAPEFHGYVSQGYLYTNHNDLQGRTTGGGTFEFNEMGINVTAWPAHRLRVGLQITASDLGKYDNDQPTIDWAYGCYEMPTPSPQDFAARVVAGRMKIGIGFYNDYRDLDMTRTTVFLPMTVYPVQMRQVFLAHNGVQSTINGSLGPFGSVDLSGFVGTANVDSSPGSPLGDLFGQGVFAVDHYSNMRADGGYVQWNTPVDGLRLRGSLLHNRHQHIDLHMLANPTITQHRFNRNFYYFIGGVEWQTGNLTLASEYSQLYMVSDVTTYASGTPIDTSQITSREHGAYFLASYRFHPQWECALGWNWAQLDHDGIPSVPDTDSSREKQFQGAVIALRFDVLKHWLVKAEFQRNRGNSIVPRLDNADRSLYWNLFALKTTFDF